MKTLDPIKVLTLSGYVFAAAGSLAAVAATGHTITQKGKAFPVKELKIVAGDSISFKNDDAVKHNILIRGIDFNSGIQEPGTESIATFSAAGTFMVRCGIHPTMKLQIVVE